MSKIEHRHKKIVDYLSSTPIATIIELAEYLDVSHETIRKDLNTLAEKNLVARVHGGVALAGKGSTSTSYDIRTNINLEKKAKIAFAASRLISPGDSIILESSTTNTELSKILLSNEELLKTLIIITNSFKIASMFDANQSCSRLFFLGGWSNFSEHSTYGQFTIKALNAFKANKAFISGAALNKDFVLTGYDDDDIQFQKQAIRSASSSILLIDSSKLNCTALLTVCDCKSFDYIVTDSNFTPDDEHKLADLDVKCIYPN